MLHKSDAYDTTSRQLLLLWLTVWLISGCGSEQKNPSLVTDENENSMLVDVVKPISNVVKADYYVDGFDYPVGKPDANRYYNAQVFGKNDHLGDDWNGTGGGNSDLGDPIYSIANGYVKYAKDLTGGWGKVVRVNHYWKDGRTCESLYAHCDEMKVKADQWVKRGDLIATIGNANGAYYAHLHFEIRSDTSLDVGGGYDSDTTGYLDPTKYIKEHRRSK